MKTILNKIKPPITALLIMTSLGFAQSSYAETNGTNIIPNEPSNLALAAAIADVKHRLMQIKPNMCLSYLREKDDNEGTIQSYKFIPKSCSDGKWVAVDTKLSNNSSDEKTWDNDALLSLDNFDFANAKLESTTEGSWVFQLPTFVNINVNSAEPDEKKTAELSNIIHAEFEVTKQSPHFISYRIFSLKPFTPEFSVEVTKFNMVNILSEAWTNGPLVTTSQTEEVEGSVGFFISLDDITIVTNSAFELVETTCSDSCDE